MHGENEGIRSRGDLVAAAAEEGANEEEGHVEKAVVFCFEHAAYAVVDDQTVKGVGVVVNGEVNVDADGGRLVLNGNEDGLGVLENMVSDEKKEPLRVGGASRGEQ